MTISVLNLTLTTDQIQYFDACADGEAQTRRQLIQSAIKFECETSRLVNAGCILLQSKKGRRIGFRMESALIGAFTDHLSQKFDLSSGSAVNLSSLLITAVWSYAVAKIDFAQSEAFPDAYVAFIENPNVKGPMTRQQVA